MTIYLPIAEMSIPVLLLIAMGCVVGFVSGLFGIGGGFLLTPALIIAGIPPHVAVASQASQIVASSFSGALSYLRQKQIDLRLCATLLGGSVFGTLAGVSVFTKLLQMGQLDIVISVGYMAIMGSMGLLLLSKALRLNRIIPNLASMLPENIVIPDMGLPVPNAIQAFFTKIQIRYRNAQVLKFDYPTSGLRLSIIPVMLIGATIGFIGSILGIGGGFILIPILISVLKVPTRIAVGTSLLQTVVTMAFTSFLQAVQNNSVDLMLAFILMIGGVFGAQIGALVGQKIKPEYLRIMLGVLIMGVAVRFFVLLVQVPDDYFQLVGK